MRSTLVVKREVPLQPLAGFGHRVVGVQLHFLILDALPQPPAKTLSRQEPLPSMLSWMPCCCTNSTKAVPVNRLPWSVFKISGVP
jgi:hypothetical protein